MSISEQLHSMPAKGQKAPAFSLKDQAGNKVALKDYKGKKVAVVGGGNSGVEAAIDLAGIVSEVVLFEYNDQLKADQVLVDKLFPYMFFL